MTSELPTGDPPLPPNMEKVQADFLAAAASLAQPNADVRERRAAPLMIDESEPFTKAQAEAFLALARLNGDERKPEGRILAVGLPKHEAGFPTFQGQRLAMIPGEDTPRPVLLVGDIADLPAGWLEMARLAYPRAFLAMKGSTGYITLDSIPPDANEGTAADLIRASFRAPEPAKLSSLPEMSVYPSKELYLADYHNNRRGRRSKRVSRGQYFVPEERLAYLARLEEDKKKAKAKKAATLKMKKAQRRRGK